MKKHTLSIAFLLCACACFGQDTTINAKDPLTFRWGRYRLDGEKISKKEAKAELLKFPSSAYLYKNSRTLTTISAVAAGIAIAFITAPPKNNVNLDKVSQVRIAGWILAGGSITTSLIGIQQRSKAVKEYNRQVIIY